MNWISVKDRLPALEIFHNRRSRPVLLIDKEDNGCIVAFLYKDRDRDHYYWYADEQTEWKHDINDMSYTHWIYTDDLPKPE